VSVFCYPGLQIDNKFESSRISFVAFNRPMSESKSRSQRENMSNYILKDKSKKTGQDRPANMRSVLD
jgi:hypothetical protein